MKKTTRQAKKREMMKIKNEVILIRNGIDKNGKQLYKEVKIYKQMPKGWRETNGTLTDPSGYKWIDNNQSHFIKDKNNSMKKNPKHKYALLERDWHKKMSEIEKQQWHTGRKLTIIRKDEKQTYGK